MSSVSEKRVTWPLPLGVRGATLSLSTCTGTLSEGGGQDYCRRKGERYREKDKGRERERKNERDRKEGGREGMSLKERERETVVQLTYRFPWAARLWGDRRVAGMRHHTENKTKE